MPSSTNKRLYYPATSVAIKPGTDVNHTYSDNAELVNGLQSMGVGADNNLTPLFQLGVLEIYENFEELPDIQITLNKLLDGNPLIYHLATVDATAPSLVGRSAVNAFVGAAIFSDTSANASGTPLTMFSCSGMFVDSISYNMSVDGQFSEDVTMVGNNRIWRKESLSGPPTYGATDHMTLPTIAFSAAMPVSDTPTATNGIASSEDMLFEFTGVPDLDANLMVDDADTTVLPPEVYGIGNSGLNEKTNGTEYDSAIQSISISTSLSRENLNELGRKGPYHKSVTFPVEVTTEIQVITKEGDLVSSQEEGIYSGVGAGNCAGVGSNLKNRTIRIATCEGFRAYLGRKNKLRSVNTSGGDTDGGNVTVSYSYTNFNDFTIMHENDPNSSYDWVDRASYLEESV